ncbi:MAG: DNA alkylation repair protein [Bacteroidaceae bacterium]|nr:DNA alkylation repair protein [Bacteroidaceae bacterium]
MIVRKTIENDIPALLDIYDAARRYMRAEGNMCQWNDNYPSADTIRADMERGGSYVCLDDKGKIAGTFFFTLGNDPTYNIIYNGSWKNELPYGVIHRIASNGNIKRLLHKVLDFCFTLTDVIRIDTHRDNKTMIGGLTAYGFEYCGIIHIANGDERKAFMKNLTQTQTQTQNLTTDLEQTMLMLADEKKRQILMRFFKTEKGEYGEGDQFLGITNPQTRSVVKLAWKSTSIAEAATLVHSSWHEIRLCGLLILVEHFQKALKQQDEATMAQVFNTYTSLHPFINNWDLVDLSAYKIIGEYEMLHPEVTLMDEWIKPDHTLWQQRISMVATWKHIRHNRYDKVTERASLLLNSRHDLLHKAAGWMLREMYKHSETGKHLHEAFLEEHISRMPSVMFSYAIERMSDSDKAYWRSRRKDISSTTK